MRAYTRDAARISGPTDFGIGEEGKWADIILLDRDPLATLPDHLSGIKVEQTYI